MNPKLAKLIVKGATGLLFSAFIGYTIKVEKKVEEQIDDYYADPKPEKTEQDN
jgi:hypothetical protein